MIRAVFFDFDGVLTTDPSGSFSTTAYLSQKYGVDRMLIEKEYKKEFHGRDKIQGKITPENWANVSARIGTDISYEDLLYAMGHPPKNDLMITLITDVQKTCGTHLITDNPMERFDAFFEFYEIAELFETATVSADVGSLKSEPHIFEVALERSGANPKESVFIDNRKGNLEVPESLGFHVYHFDDEKNDVPAFRAYLQSLGVAV